ncbi:RidA family protein [Shinella daejeonensis]|uniref:RidA family protein n=1 Tax=Shinella daejeonensis TaxID=659017 RepID=UPI0020C7F71F|nr:RidA family protein [Shinella daejeonensis]MCP8896563.1 RidA family protein [Shinella daejeonensis]
MPSQNAQGASLADTTVLAPVSPGGTYRTVRKVGNMIYLSGQGPMRGGDAYHTGKVGADVDTLEAYQHARLVGRQMLATLENAGFDLARIEAVKVLGMVNAAPLFGDHPAVINGFSDYLVERLGQRGEHARSAVGMGSLPHNMTVEIEAIFHLID